MKIERTFTFEVDKQVWAREFGLTNSEAAEDFGNYIDLHAHEAMTAGLGSLVAAGGKVEPTSPSRSPVIYRIEGADLELVLRHLGLEDKPLPGEEKGFVPIRTLRIGIDGGVKVKVNELHWSAPRGTEENAANDATYNTISTGTRTHIVVMHLDETNKRTWCGHTRTGWVERRPLSAVDCTGCANSAKAAQTERNRG